MKRLLLFPLCALLSFYAHAQQAGDSQSAEDKPVNAFERRYASELKTRFQPFVLSPHKPNYILPYAYNDKPNQIPFTGTDGYTLDNEEIKFQISVKFAMADNLFGEHGSIYFAYTNQSYWQAYNSESSRPFRETNHEPELFLTVPNDYEILGFKNRLNSLGIVHQSNGQRGTLSRSWNRVYLDMIFERGDFYFSIKPWIRLSDSQDDNPDIEDYMGHGELRVAYATGKHTANLMLRNNLGSNDQGAIELNYSYPMSRRAKWFVQIFEGYGESLIDYDARVKRFGIGFALTDWL